MVGLCMPNKQLSSLQNSVSFTLNLLTFDRALKKVPKRVESCAWARLVTFLQSNNKTWSQQCDLKYDGDAISVMHGYGVQVKGGLVTALTLWHWKRISGIV